MIPASGECFDKVKLIKTYYGHSPVIDSGLGALSGMPQLMCVGIGSVGGFTKGGGGVANGGGGSGGKS